MIEYLVQNPSTAAALLSAIAAVAAAFATWQGPRSAARLAEQFRSKTERETELRCMKLQVFSTLMQERATIWSLESVRMLNSIDFVFADSAAVREAWADLFSIFGGTDTPHLQLREDKLRRLLKEITIDMGLSDKLKVDDISRIYYPNALAREEEIRTLQQEQALLRLRSPDVEQGPSPPTGASKFPPPPA